MQRCEVGTHKLLISVSTEEAKEVRWMESMMMRRGKNGFVLQTTRVAEMGVLEEINCTWGSFSGSEWGSAARSVSHYSSEEQSAARGAVLMIPAL